MKTDLRVMFTRVSWNAKIGPMPVSTVEERSCPSACPLKGNGCYAEYGPLRGVWDAVSAEFVPESAQGRSRAAKVTDWEGYCAAVRALPKGKMWRHAQAGDLAGDSESSKLDEESCIALAEANVGRRGFGYTHYPIGSDPIGKHNLAVLLRMKELGFCVNLSADSLVEVDELCGHGLPVSTVLPVQRSGEPTRKETIMTPAGNKVIVCPATTHGIQCIDCGLCQKKDRKVVIGFPAHGTGKLKATRVFNKLTVGE